jgi:hypothetical protein
MNLLAALLLLVGVPAAHWRTIVVGGGPSPAMNQAAIEAHVRFVDRIVPPSIERRVLFADGARDHGTVQFVDGPRGLRYRAPRLARLDGAATGEGFGAAWKSVAAGHGGDPLLLYFAGHGSKNGRDLANNSYDLWRGGNLTVRQLAAKLEELPPRAPVVLVMAQCFSGSFANVLFEGGRPDGALVDRDVVGFFAATADRPASGCTPEVNEAEYQDFSSYFFAALAGRDRTGRPVVDADYDRNGLVGMNEAFAYAIIHQKSEDVPTATSDAFLRRFVNRDDTFFTEVPYTEILAAAAPEQRAALEALSAELGLSGEERVRRAYRTYFGGGEPDDARAAHLLRLVRVAKSVVLARELARSGDDVLRSRWARLRAMEARNPIHEMRGTGT